MTDFKQSILRILVVMTVFIGGSLAASADIVTEGFDTFKAGWNSGWTAWEVVMPDAWDYVDDNRVYSADRDTYKTKAPSVCSDANNSSSYLITPALEGEFSFYIRNYTKSYQASIKAFACTFEGGTLTLGAELGSKTLAKTSSGVPSWEKVSFTAPVGTGTRVALLISRAYFDDFTYTPYVQAATASLYVSDYASGSTFDFGSVVEGTTHTFTLNNSGQADLTITGIFVSGGYTITAGSDLATIAAGASADVTLSTPAADATGALTIESNDPNSPYVINLTSTCKVPAPVMGVSISEVNFGKVTENAEQIITVANTGDVELVADITSSSEEFTVLPATLTVAAGAEATFTLTYNYQAEAYGTHTATVTVTPNAGEPATIAVSAFVADPNLWTEDFEENALPNDWKADANWTFSDGVAHGKYVHNANNYLTTPALIVSGTADQLMFQARQTGVYPDIKIEMSLNGGEWTSLKTIKSDDITDAWQTYTIEGLAAGSYQFRFLSDSYDLDNFEGFRLNQEAPEMQFAAEDFLAGKVTESVSKTYTVSNSGTGTLVVNISSDNEAFTVSPAQLEISGEAAQFTVTFTPQEGVYGKFEATITVTPTYNEAAAVSFKASAQVSDPDLWSEDFEDNQLPDGWNIIGTVSKWTFANGEASASYEPGGWLVTPKLTVEAGQEMTFQAKSKQYGTDLIVQSQKDGGEWTELFTKSYESSTDYETYTVAGLEAGIYQFRIATENLYLDNFEGFKLAPSTATKETWHISYTFHYMGAGGNEVADTDTEDIEIAFDGDDIAFNFPNPINGNTWMTGAKYQGEGPAAYVFPNGQYIGKYGSEDVFDCGSNGNELTDMVFYYDEEAEAFFNFEHILINSSSTAISYWGYFSDVVIYKNQMPLVSTDDIPTDLTAHAVTSSSVVLSWTSDATLFNVQYKAEEDEDWTDVPELISDNEYSIEGLAPSTTYSVRVRAYYNLAHVSEWTEPISFTTLKEVDTGITVSTKDKVQSTNCYDLQGRRVTQPQSGHLYIIRINGQAHKVIVK